MSDLIILEFLHEGNLELPPKPIYRNLNRQGYDIGYSTVRGRVTELQDNGLLMKDEDGYYQLSELGRSFAKGEVSSTEEETLNSKTSDI